MGDSFNDPDRDKKSRRAPPPPPIRSINQSDNRRSSTSRSGNTVRFSNEALQPTSSTSPSDLNRPGRAVLASAVNANSSSSPKRSSPLSSPPLMNKNQTEEPEEAEDYFSQRRPSNTNSNDSPSIYLTRPDESELNLIDSSTDTIRSGAYPVRRSSRTREAFDDNDDEEGSSGIGYDYNGGQDEDEYLLPNQEPRPPQNAHTVNNDINDPHTQSNILSNLFQMGLYSSGMAPGASNYRNDPEGDDVGNDLRDRREALLKSLGSLSAPESASSTPASFVEGIEMKEGDIPLLDLDRRLSEVKEAKEVAEYQEIAENLVRSHTLHKSKYGHAGTTDGDGNATEGGFDKSKGYLVSAEDYYDAYSDIGEEAPETNVEESTDSGQKGESSNKSDGHHHFAGFFGASEHHEDWVAPPKHVKQGVLGSLLKLYADDESERSQATMVNSEPDSPKGSTEKGPTRPLFKQTKSTEQVPKAHRPKWYNHKHSRSMNSLGGLIMSTNQAFAAPAAEGTGTPGSTHQPHPHKHGGIRPKMIKRHSGNVIKKRKKERDEQRKYITVHIADVLQRQRFLLRMCRALMLYGAPTHRLEEYMKMSARVLEINGQFLYIPGCMIVSFGDPSTHTSEMQLVRCVQGLNLYKLHKAHIIYKEVLHDMINVEEASERIDQLLASKNQYPEWLCVVLFGLASSMVTPFAFGGWWPDLPMSFLLGGAVGILQVVVAPRSDLYNNVFEVTSSIVVSFLSRAFGTISSGGEKVFCFAAVCQGSLAMILPGFMILTGSLELQSKNIVSGSVRMFYAVIYSIFLGFGITLGAAIYGWIDSNAVNDLTCSKSISPWFKFLFVPGYTLFIAFVNQASFRQLPIMIVIGCAGYAVTYFTNLRVPGSSEFTSAIGAFIIGIMGNIYSRVGHGLAFAAMLPGIFSQLPGSVAAQGSLVAGLQNANQLVAKKNKTTIIQTMTEASHTYTTTIVTRLAEATTSPPTTTGGSSSKDSNVLSLGLTMIEVCIGITVGLFVATLVIYPFGKKRSGLFTF